MEKSDALVNKIILKWKQERSSKEQPRRETAREPGEPGLYRLSPSLAPKAANKKEENIDKSREGERER